MQAEGFWREEDFILEHGFHFLDRRTMQSLGTILTKNAYITMAEPFGVVVTENGSKLTIHGIVEFKKHRGWQQLDFPPYPPLVAPFNASEFSTDAESKKTKRAHEKLVEENLAERMDLWRQVYDYTVEQKCEVQCE